jgi:hypothetical protein
MNAAVQFMARGNGRLDVPSRAAAVQVLRLCAWR